MPSITSARNYRLDQSVAALRDRFKVLHTNIRVAALGSIEAGGAHEVDRETSADTIFAIDKHVDPVLEAFFEDWGRELPLVLVAEGLETNGVGGDVLGDGVRLFGCNALNDAQIVVIVDPIDGTRGLMYDKRPAWLLCGVARHTAERWPARLSDVDFSYMGELPTSKQAWVDAWWAGRGQGAYGEQHNLYTEARRELRPAPSRAANLDKGFAMLSKFFPFGKPLLAEVEHRLLHALGLVNGSAVVFDDQYICTGGQLAELVLGRDRFNADLRCWAYDALREPQGLCVHPYDLAGLLVAEEAGVLITDARGRPLDGPLDCTTGLDWVGYANAELKVDVQPKLLAAMAACAGHVPRLLDAQSDLRFPPFERTADAFRHVDVLGSGFVKRDDLANVMRTLDPSFTTEAVDAMLVAAHVADDASVDYMKLLRWMFDGCDHNRM
eukprot:TRINITY_DN25219_c0_g1_i1.p1 TRINITY_DN25219_c0_g1~~TRINITY_DN25219_c0_g1_i1.p1  ORF type:complete len:483 (-),score=55.00 TRINITY_DN25219_c0_g1_i1:30-1346(-)